MNKADKVEMTGEGGVEGRENGDDMPAEWRSNHGLDGWIAMWTDGIG